jgi:CBS domain-containing protein
MFHPGFSTIRNVMNETRQALAPILVFLQQHSPFNQMRSSHLEYLAMHLNQVFYADNEVIISPKDGPARSFYIIKQGRVRGEALVGADTDSYNDNIWELVPGECFPIGALLANRAVSLQQRASESTICYELKQPHFDNLIQRCPVFKDFCSRRLANLLDQALHEVQISHATLTENNPDLNSTLKHLIKRDLCSCEQTTSIKQTLQLMHKNQVGSMVIVDANNHAVGIFTLHDLLEKVSLKGVSLDLPVNQVMSSPIHTLKENNFAYDAMLLMASKGISHVCIVNNELEPTGMISERDLFSLQSVGLAKLSRLIPSARNISALSELSHLIPQIIDQLLAQGSTVHQLTKIIAQLNDHITNRVIEIILAEHPDLPEFTWLAFGSEGRSEQTLKTDQDNGIIFKCSENGCEDDYRAKLLPVAKQINLALEQCGFPLCPGNIMSSNPECCLSLTEWKNRFSRWIDQGTPEHLLQANIFFDYRPLYLHKQNHNSTEGLSQLTDQLDDFLLDLTHKNSRFRLQLAQNALRIRPPLGLLRDFQLSHDDKHPHTVDLKLNGLTPFIDAARIIALKHHIKAKGTHERFQAAAKLNVLKQSDVDSWIESYDFIQLLRMKLHKEQMRQGIALHNHIDPYSLNELNQRILKEAFRQARKLQSYLEREYQL